MEPLTLNPKQVEALELARGPARTILFRGGTGSGKSVAAVYYIIMRALHWPGSRHACFRTTAVDVRATLFDQTFKDIFNRVIEAPVEGMTGWDWFREQGLITLDPMRVKFPNGSVVLFTGLDDNAALQRVLGADYATVFVNEASLVQTFGLIQTLRGRLRQKIVVDGKEMVPKCIVDMNPPSKRHWSYAVFKKGINPETGNPLKNQAAWAEIRMNAEANRENLSEGYLEEMTGDLDFKKQKQFVDGEWYDEVENPLFSGEDLAATRLPHRVPPTQDADSCLDLTRIEVAVDPSTTKTGDETGIVVVGRDDDNHAYVLEDLSGKYHPQEWAKVVCDAFHRWKASNVICERNQGGEMVSGNIQTYDMNVPVKVIWASQGKVIRAEAASNAFRQRRIHFCGSMPKLEDQLLSLEEHMDRRNYSPDRADALIHGLNSILLIPVEKKGGKGKAVAGFWA